MKDTLSGSVLVQWDVAKKHTHDASGISNPENYLWGIINVLDINVFFPLRKIEVLTDESSDSNEDYRPQNATTQAERASWWRQKGSYNLELIARISEIKREKL